MNEELKNDLLAYEDLKIEEKELKVRIDELKEKILPYIGEDEKINCIKGVIEIKKRDNWTFSPETQNFENQLKDKKADEIARGIATSKPTMFMEYRLTKKEGSDE